MATLPLTQVQGETIGTSELLLSVHCTVCIGEGALSDDFVLLDLAKAVDGPEHNHKVTV